MAKLPWVYWDACTWIAYINQEKSVLGKDGTLENRFAKCLEVLDQANNKSLEIVTSAFTLAEVCKNPNVRESPLDNLPAFFEKSYILVVPVDMSIGRRAQTMQASGLVSLKPPDSIHLASAIRAKVTELHTFDRGILQLDGLVPGADGKPLKICKPSEGLPLGPLFEGDEDERED
ncbi:type II toxin-antitoxin system VapC family toxin [Lentibacter sp. XHP0401]|uniref:type II toxin-antitoxin system VapC family toxin n=1 Tax=Lentibacter sp. XHP0401 TaxID=2984334 RepID=UPI0021E6DA54|nr:type II toxin-antitoxin system VapC family toxin [Lentibacter sp. XHP0401]MCV2892452.1 type II toxin-antitoxin system VapC family toxin [Lentibacter sp. XHP0401]